MKQSIVGALAFFASLSVAVPAAAVGDLTGTYKVNLSCQARDSGVFGKFKEKSLVEILDDRSGVLLINWPGFFEFRAFVVPDAKKAKRGAVAGVNCNLNIDTLDGAVLAADVKAKPGSKKATIEGTMIVQRQALEAIFTCTIKGKRISTVASQFDFCE